MCRFVILILALQTVLTLRGQVAPSQVPAFRDISQFSGLTVSHISTKNKDFMVESMSGGVGFIDCDNDGKLDIITTNGSTMSRHLAGQDPPMITLYHQENELKFRDITAEAGLTRKGWGMGIAVADFDNDGWQDIYVTGFGGSVLYRNKGNCKFEDVTEKAGAGVTGFPAGATWGDYDRDGFVDLFVPRYAHEALPHSPKDIHFCTFLGLRVFCGPWGFPGETDYLFHNRGNGTFQDVSAKSGVDDKEHLAGLQGIWADLDNDGWPDLYVTNDRGPNYLYRNKHNGTFEEIGFLSGTMVGADGNPQGSMGVDVQDLNHTGKLDIFVTNFQQESDTLYQNRGPLGFEDISIPSGIAKATFNYVGWGTGMVDFTNSGWDDIFIANGHIYPQIDSTGMAFHYREPLLLFHNNRNGTFSDITGLAGLNQLPLQSRRGVAFGDVNNDGKIDVLILNVGAPPTLLLNCSPDSGHAVLLKLIGTRSNRAAIGARAIVAAQDLKQIQEVRSGSSYLSQNDLRLHFGLGEHTQITRLEIEWPSGAKQILNAIPADSIYTIQEGRGIIASEPFKPSAVCTNNAPSHRSAGAK